MSTDLYDPNVPAKPGDSLAVTQPVFLNNFEKLFDVFRRNHVNLNDPTSPGNHTVVELKQQESAFQADLNEIAIYSKDVENQTDQVFFRYQNNLTEFQFTNYQIYTVNDTTYFSTLPGKIMIYFGSFNSSSSKVFYYYPAVLKNIIFVSFCPSGVTPNTGPYFSNISRNGLYIGLKLRKRSPGGTLPANFSYFIMGNM